jgi:hypothetical protein
MPAIACSIHEKISQRDPGEWDEVVRASGAGIRMSHGFVEHLPTTKPRKKPG